MLLDQPVVRRSFIFYDVDVAVKTHINAPLELFLLFVQDVSYLDKALSDYILLFLHLCTNLFLLIFVRLHDSA